MYIDYEILMAGTLSFLAAFTWHDVITKSIKRGLLSKENDVVIAIICALVTTSIVITLVYLLNYYDSKHVSSVDINHRYFQRKPIKI